MSPSRPSTPRLSRRRPRRVGRRRHWTTRSSPPPPPPMAVIVAFVASIMLLMGGIYYTDKFIITASLHGRDDLSFDPPIPTFVLGVGDGGSTNISIRHDRNLSVVGGSGNNTITQDNNNNNNSSHVKQVQERFVITKRRQRQQRNNNNNAATANGSNTQRSQPQQQDNNNNNNNNDDDIANVTLLDKGDVTNITSNTTTAVTTSVTVTDLTPKSFPYAPQVANLGVLVDAGRHYFSIEWLRELVDVLARLGYNLIHFRLTDDQVFNIRLDAYPTLAKPSAVLNPDGRVYTKNELRDFVAYAADKNISVMPEVNVPGHAGGWAGNSTQIPNLVVSCPEFICLKGYGIPLNLTHPLVMDIIRHTIIEVVDIFQTSPYLHLGGDEVEMSQACFDEANIPMYNYTKFESELKEMLTRDLNISLDHVLRWEMTPGHKHKVDPTDRAGNMNHWWIGHGYKKTNNDTAKPWFVSQGLYFDSNGDENGWSIYRQALMQASLDHPPTAIVAGTFELSTVTWVDRNVLGRLLAVAMGAAKLQYNKTKDFERDYLRYCHMVGIDDRQCSAIGMPILHQKLYKKRWNLDWDAWKGDICERLTVEHVRPVMRKQDRYKRVALTHASHEFWNSFGLNHPVHHVVRVAKDNGKEATVASLPNLAVNHLGLVVDLVHGMTDSSTPQERVARLKGIIDDMAMLGFNLLQLRIMDEFGMALALHSLPTLAFVPNGTAIWDTDSIKSVVTYASRKGIRVMPEITLSTFSGGWANAGVLADCPNVICNRGHGVAIDVRDSTVVQIFAIVIRELKGLFSSHFIHLGYDERQEANACYEEANIGIGKLGEWEQRLEAVLRLEGIAGENVLRWENTEHFHFPHRAGLVTNYRDVRLLRNSSVPFFVTTDLSNTTATVWDIYRRTNEITQAGPSGIMASIELVQHWDSLEMRERLLTVSMGARKMIIRDEARLRTLFTETCKRLRLKNCESFVAQNTEKVSRQLDLETKRALRASELCAAVTEKKTVKIPRKGVLVPS